MGRVFTVNVDESFFDVLVQHIFSEYEREKISEVKIILPCKRDVIALLNAFKNYNAKKCIILPEIISLENIDEEDLILNLDRVKIINPTKRTLLLIQFILEWNKKNNDNFPIDLAYSLPSLLDKIQCAQITDCYQFNEHSEKIENFINLLIETWSKTLKDLRIADILKHKSDCINNMIISLQKDQHIIFVGIGKGEIYKSLIKAIYDLPFGKIILPNLNLKIKEKEWKALDKKHYQYFLKDLLNYLNISRETVNFLPEARSPTGGTGICDQGTYLDYIFDTTADLSKVSNGYSGNIEIITCDSVEEEAQVISLIIENEGYENVSLFSFDKLLAARIACLSRQHSTISENYPYITLLLYSIEILTSNWNSVPLLSLLKHRLVTFGYTQEEYGQILSEFEIEILRSFSTSGFNDIINAVNAHKKLKYKEDISLIINKLKAIFNPLFDYINCPISDIVTAHLQCINILSSINFSGLNNQIGNFIYNFLNACEGVAIKCSLELYSKILTLFFKKEFFSVASDLNKFSLCHNKIAILAGFNEVPSFQSPFLNATTKEKFNLPSSQEEQGYFLYTLRNLFCASKVYITRSLNNSKPILLQRLGILLKESSLPKQPYRDWLRMLNTPKCIVPCTQPMPKPQAEVREEKMQVISCSAVEKLIRNPYSFYVEYILNLKQLRDLNFKPSILEFGTMVHNILERYLRDKKLPMSIAREAFSTSRFNFSNMWWVRAQGIIQSFVEFDKARNNHVELEKSFSYPISPDDIQLYERCSVEGKSTKNDVISIPSFLSSQCVTLGSRYKNICELCNEQQIFGAYNVNGENKMDPSVRYSDDTGRATLTTGKIDNQIAIETQRSYSCVSATCMKKERTKMINKLQEILLTARCDRVEYLPSGQVVIIDYKLGSPPSNEEVMSGFFPQLILQALAVEYMTKREVSELAYWKLDYNKIKVIALKGYRHKMREFQNDLPNFLSSYLRDTTPFIASPYFDKFLRFNSYKQLERVGEW